MSDQPKPTTGERTTGEWTCGGDDIQPKPETREWTEKRFRAFLTFAANRSMDPDAVEHVCNVINAELAAEREHVARLQRLETTLQSALAAERSKVRTLVDALNGLIRVIPNDERLADMVTELDTCEYALAKVKEGK